MNIVRIILLNLAIINVLLWINHEILHIFRFKKRVLAYSLGGGALAAGLVLLYATITQTLPLERTIQSGHSIKSFALLSIYIIAILIIARRPRKNNYFKTIITTLIAVITGYLLITYVTNTAIQLIAGYFLLVAYAEENLKLIGVRNEANAHLIKKSDLILCGTISGLGFAFIESIAVSTSLLHTIDRFPLFFIHAVFTSYVAYGLYKSDQSKTHRISPLVLVSIIMFHTLYNIRANEFSTLIWVVIGLATYFLYILIQNQSDSLYYQTNET